MNLVPMRLEVLSGRDVDRALRGFRLVDEVMNILFLRQFKIWCEAKGNLIPDKVDQLFSKLADHTSKGGDPSSLLIKLESVLHRYILPLIDEFRSAGREASITFCVWDAFLRRVIMPVNFLVCHTSA